MAIKRSLSLAILNIAPGRNSSVSASFLTNLIPPTGSLGSIGIIGISGLFSNDNSTILPVSLFSVMVNFKGVSFNS